ncbi:MAG: hypothetical protein JNN13_04885 [Planctomycetes bacterium]|nr:hypothetical protein [Planctomycetota bacterium]
MHLATFLRSPLFWITATAFLVTGVLSSKASGIASGSGGAPANSSRALASCSACHSGSAPTPTRTNPPITNLTVGARVLNAGQQTTMTTAVTAGLSGTTGGFLCETTGGTFGAGTGSHINGTGGSITHSNKNQRSWSYTFTAPSTPGPIEVTSVAMTSNGSGSSGDQFSFSGYDPNATSGTPVRLYVLPAGVTNLGIGCADGYGNVPVLGAASSPTLGNAAFAFHLVGGSTNAVALLLLGINPPGFTGVDLGALLGITGCNGYVLNPLGIPTAVTSTGSAIQAAGSTSFPFPIPSGSSYLGFAFDAQAGVLDASVASTRAFPLTMTNGLHVVFQ